MLQAPLILLALAGEAGQCDLRATIAGELMTRYLQGAAPPALTAAAQASLGSTLAASLVARLVAAESTPDPAARELAAFHFAAEVHAECLTSDAGVS